MTRPSPYEIEFTHAAKVQAGDGLKAVEEMIRGKIAEDMMEGGVLEDAPDDPGKLIIHVIAKSETNQEDVEGAEWLLTGDGPGHVTVDILEWVEMEVDFPKGHPFHGKKVKMPKGFEQ